MTTVLGMARAMRQYDIAVTREGDWILIEVPELDIVTQARRVDEVVAQARSLIATWLGVAPSSFDVRISQQ